MVALDHPKAGEEDRQQHLRVKRMPKRELIANGGSNCVRNDRF